MSLSADYIRTSLQELYGESVTAGDIRAWCAMNGSNYQTVTNKLTDYKVGRGKWNLEVTQQKVEEIERTYQAPDALPSICLLYTSPSPRDRTRSRMPSSA